jgi:hypothetical protein
MQYKLTTNMCTLQIFCFRLTKARHAGNGKAKRGRDGKGGEDRKREGKEREKGKGKTKDWRGGSKEEERVGDETGGENTPQDKILATPLLEPSVYTNSS